jgi:hypothetical protein
MITRIFPILVLEHGIPQIPLVTTPLRKQIADQTGLIDEAERFEFWDLEELEIAAPYLTSGLAALIHEKHSAGLADYPFKNFMSEKNKHSELSGYVVQLYDSTGSEIQRLLFGDRKVGESA